MIIYHFFSVSYSLSIANFSRGVIEIAIVLKPQSPSVTIIFFLHNFEPHWLVIFVLSQLSSTIFDNEPF